MMAQNFFVENRSPNDERFLPLMLLGIRWNVSVIKDVAQSLLVDFAI